MRSFPFDSQVTYDDDGVPSYDRAVDSSLLAEKLALLFSTGVFADPSTGLQVTTNANNMSVTVQAGNCNIQGHLAIEDADRTIVFETAGTTYDRIDRVVARLNTNLAYRNIDLYVLKGTETSSPTAPSLTRTGGIYELCLANVFIAKNTTTISAQRITDTRLNTDLCGVVTALPQSIDTTAIFNQYQAALNDFLASADDLIDATLYGKILNDISDVFSTSSTYAIGDYCIYENTLYKCTTAVSTAGAWDSTKWTAKSVTNEIKALQEADTQINFNLSVLGTITTDYTDQKAEGTSISADSWQSICYKRLNAGVYSLNAKLTLSSASATTKMLRFIKTNTSNVITQTSVTTERGYIELNGYIELTEAATIYLQAYSTTEVASLGAREFNTLRVK